MNADMEVVDLIEIVADKLVKYETQSSANDSLSISKIIINHFV